MSRREPLMDDTEKQLKEILEADPGNAKVRNNLATHYQGCGRTQEAVREYRLAIEARPDDPQLQYNLATALPPEEGLPILMQALKQHPERSLIHYGLGCILYELHRYDEALASFGKATELRPDDPDGWYGLGTIYHARDEFEDAIRCYRKVVTLKPDHPSATHLLTALAGEISEAPPDEFVKDLFDSYADRYDLHLTEILQYQGHILVDKAIRNSLDGNGLSVLDLGCGTGLFGDRIRSIAIRLVGVDLSPEMLRQAKNREIYDKLVESEMARYLAVAEPFDVVAAVDVFSYLGNLEEVFRCVRGILRPHGRFAFTVEAGTKDYTLGAGGRYKHSREYLEGLIQATGFQALSFDKEVLRTESYQPCQGFVVVLA